MTTLETPIKVGEGTYGCIYNPSLKCAENGNVSGASGSLRQLKINYSNKVSKILERDEADDEYSQYGLISTIDPSGKYFLQKPIKCDIDASQENIVAIKNCEVVDTAKFITKPSRYSLLIMENGGINLADYMAYHRQNDSLRLTDLENILIKMFDVFVAIKLLLGRELIHNDMKPQNILIDPTTFDLKIIDLGLLYRKETMITQCLRSVCMLPAVFHWSYPFETVFANLKMFSAAQRSIKIKEDQFIKKLFADEHTRSFFKYVVNIEDIRKITQEFYEYLDTSFAKSPTEKMKMAHMRFLKKHLQTKDIYGAGFGCFYLLQIFGKKLLSNPAFAIFYDLFYNMITPNLDARYTIDRLLSEYLRALIVTGILKKHDVSVASMLNKVKFDYIYKNDLMQERIPDPHAKEISPLVSKLKYQPLSKKQTSKVYKDYPFKSPTKAEKNITTNKLFDFFSDTMKQEFFLSRNRTRKIVAQKT